MKKSRLRRPALTDASGSKTELSESGKPHCLEQEVLRHLCSQPGLKFSSLVVHRIPAGVCLEGSLQSTCGCDDISRLALQVAGVNDVLNRLLLLPQQPEEENCGSNSSI